MPHTRQTQRVNGHGQSNSSHLRKSNGPSFGNYLTEILKFHSNFIPWINTFYLSSQISSSSSNIPIHVSITYQAYQLYKLFCLQLQANIQRNQQKNSLFCFDAAAFKISNQQQCPIVSTHKWKYPEQICELVFLVSSHTLPICFSLTDLKSTASNISSLNHVYAACHGEIQQKQLMLINLNQPQILEFSKSSFEV